MKNKIPKTIHYCWFGRNPEPELMRRCIDSWKKHMPEYEIKRWDERNFDIEAYPFAKEAYEAKKWAFVSDVARAVVLYEYGGVYLDTDTEVLQNFEPFLEHAAFGGFENETFVQAGVLGSIKRHPWIKDLKRYYETHAFDTTPIPRILTSISKEYGLIQNNRFQILKEDVAVYPSQVFCPKSYYHYDAAKIVNLAESYAVHHYAASWHTPWQKLKRDLQRRMTRYIGDAWLQSWFKMRYRKNGERQ